MVRIMGTNTKTKQKIKNNQKFRLRVKKLANNKIRSTDEFRLVYSLMKHTVFHLDSLYNNRLAFFHLSTETIAIVGQHVEMQKLF